MTEWLKVPVLKTGIPARVSGVRIPPSPPPGYCMDLDVLVRPYEIRDRDAVRKIACDTADRGAAINRFFPDRDLFADLLISYYTDYEPGSSWVVQYEKEIVGYLTGCLDNRRHQWMLWWCVFPKAFFRAVRSGALWHREVWRGIRRAVTKGFFSIFRKGVPLANYPAHLHINILKNFRGQHAGQRLVEKFCEQVKTAGLKGVYASVREDNAPARLFFEQMGFTVIGRRPRIWLAGEDQQNTDTVIYGKPL